MQEHSLNLKPDSSPIFHDTKKRGIVYSSIARNQRRPKMRLERSGKHRVPVKSLERLVDRQHLVTSSAAGTGQKRSTVDPKVVQSSLDTPIPRLSSLVPITQRKISEGSHVLEKVQRGKTKPKRRDHRQDGRAGHPAMFSQVPTSTKTQPVEIQQASSPTPDSLELTTDLPALALYDDSHIDDSSHISNPSTQQDEAIVLAAEDRPLSRLQKQIRGELAPTREQAAQHGRPIKLTIRDRCDNQSIGDGFETHELVPVAHTMKLKRRGSQDRRALIWRSPLRLVQETVQEIGVSRGKADLHRHQGSSQHPDLPVLPPAPSLLVNYTSPHKDETRLNALTTSPGQDMIRHECRVEDGVLLFSGLDHASSPSDRAGKERLVTAHGGGSFEQLDESRGLAGKTRELENVACSPSEHAFILEGGGDDFVVQHGMLESGNGRLLFETLALGRTQQDQPTLGHDLRIANADPIRKRAPGREWRTEPRLSSALVNVQILRSEAYIEATSRYRDIAY